MDCFTPFLTPIRRVLAEIHAKTGSEWQNNGVTDHING